MVKAIKAFLEFCYLVRREVITTSTLAAIEQALADFHQERVVFEELGVRVGFSLPRQHSLKHYPALIQQFGAPNGLCSSITESKHIKAVKEPWRRSNKYKALGQMLLTNQRLDKLHAARVDFTARGMLGGPRAHPLPAIPEGDIWDGRGLDEEAQPDNIPRDAAARHQIIAEDEDGGAIDDEPLAEVFLAKRKGMPFYLRQKCATRTLTSITVRGLPKHLEELAVAINVPKLPELLQRFLLVQIRPDGAQMRSEDVPLANCPPAPPRIDVYPSAVAVFRAPSDVCGTKGMTKERIRSVSSWRGGPPRHDCAFVVEDETQPGFRGLSVVRVHLLFSFKYANGVTYPCALVSWFVPIGDSPCDETGMWIVEPLVDDHGRRVISVIHLDCMLRAAHLIGVADGPLPYQLSHTDSLDAFQAFYVNKYADHHAHEIAS